MFHNLNRYWFPMSGGTLSFFFHPISVPTNPPTTFPLDSGVVDNMPRMLIKRAAAARGRKYCDMVSDFARPLRPAPNAGAIISAPLRDSGDSNDLAPIGFAEPVSLIIYCSKRGKIPPHLRFQTAN